MLPLPADYNSITNYIKRNIEAFLTEMDDFYPFGAAVLNNGELQPLSAYLDEDEASTETLLPILENHLKEKVTNNEYRLGAVAIAILIKEDGLSFDGVQIRFYHPDGNLEYLNYKYLTDDKKITTWL